MAGARTPRIGTIFSRTQGLLRSGAMKPEDRPLWFNVYERFPPKIPPQMERLRPKEDVPIILYPEDVIRAKYYEHYNDTDVVDLKDQTYRTRCNRFISEYKAARSDGDTSSDLFDRLLIDFAEKNIKREYTQTEADKKIVVIDSTDYKDKLHKKMLTSADIFGEVGVSESQREDVGDEEDNIR